MTLGGAKRGYVKTWTNPYVTDGLIAMWDGEWNAGGGVHDPNATVWKDLASSSDVEVVGSISWNDKSAVFSGAGYFEKIIQSVEDAITDGNITIEVVEAYDPTSTLSSLFSINHNTIGNGSRPLWLFNQSNSKLGATFRQSGSQTIFNFDVTKPHLYTQSGNTAYLNGQMIGNTTDGVRYVGGRVTLGKFVYNNSSAKGKLFSVRIYNELFTAQQISEKFKIDKARFNLPD